MLGHLEVFVAERRKVLLTLLFDGRELVDDLLVELKVSLFDQMVFNIFTLVVRLSMADLVESSVSKDLFDFLNKAVAFEDDLVNGG